MKWRKERIENREKKEENKEGEGKRVGRKKSDRELDLVL
jgi:hypothetical protein